MSRATDSLRTRLILSHIVVVVIGVTTVLISTSFFAPSFLGEHLRSMEGAGGASLGQQAVADFESGVLQGFGRAIFASAALSMIVALVVGLIASRRLVRPLHQIGAATRRLASGAYSERVELPQEAELAALAEDVNTLASELEATEQRRLRLVAEVAHELRTPLTTIHGYMEGLMDGVFAPSDDIYRAVDREAARLGRLATDLAELSAIEEGNYRLHLETHDLSSDLSALVELLTPQFKAKKVNLIVGPLTPIHIRADRDRIGQILTNILTNALAHTPEGGAVTVIGSTNASTTHVYITDTGRGLTEEQTSLVFHRFYRADRSVPGGAGIGLTIARSLARAHRGDLEVSSPGLGEGTTFTLSLPSPKAKQGTIGS
jgi:signal transduction histidine kinase